MASVLSLPYRRGMAIAQHQHHGESLGSLLQTWRKRRRLSQLELASVAGVSTRHLSFLETGRSRASRELVHHLAEHLDIPLRERNRLLLAGGFAPTYTETPIDAPEMTVVREALDLLMASHEPYPAIVLNRRFELVTGNQAIGILIEGVAAHLLQPPINSARVALHPEGLAQRVLNLPEYRAHILDSVQRSAVASGDPFLADLYEEISGYPDPDGHRYDESAEPPSVVLPVRLRSDDGDLAFFSILATFGTPRDVTVAELAIESFFPADRHTEAVLRKRASG
jgi:transcriptional regulator with XRE-family HTH domain